MAVTLIFDAQYVVQTGSPFAPQPWLCCELPKRAPWSSGVGRWTPLWNRSGSARGLRHLGSAAGFDGVVVTPLT